MTAERAIGPAFGIYATGAPDNQRPVLVPMVNRAPNVPPDHRSLRYLRQAKNGQQPSPCPGGHACWGADGTIQALDYECCQAHEECYVKNNGDPGCRMSKTALKALTPVRELGRWSPWGDLVKLIKG
jgi:hypothetical protein